MNASASNCSQQFSNQIDRDQKAEKKDSKNLQASFTIQKNESWEAISQQNKPLRFPELNIHDLREVLNKNNDVLSPRTQQHHQHAQRKNDMNSKIKKSTSKPKKPSDLDIEHNRQSDKEEPLEKNHLLQSKHFSDPNASSHEQKSPIDYDDPQQIIKSLRKVIYYIDMIIIRRHQPFVIEEEDTIKIKQQLLEYKRNKDQLFSQQLLYGESLKEIKFSFCSININNLRIRLKEFKECFNEFEKQIKSMKQCKKQFLYRFHDDMDDTDIIQLIEDYRQQIYLINLALLITFELCKLPKSLWTTQLIKWFSILSDFEEIILIKGQIQQKNYQMNDQFVSFQVILQTFEEQDLNRGGDIQHEVNDQEIRNDRIRRYSLQEIADEMNEMAHA